MAQLATVFSRQDLLFVYRQRAVLSAVVASRGPVVVGVDPC